MNKSTNKSRKSAQKLKWVSDSVSELIKDDEVQFSIIQAIKKEDIVYADTYGIWLILCDEPNADAKQCILSYINSRYSKVLVGNYDADFIVMPLVMDIETLRKDSELFASYMKEKGIHANLLLATSFVALQDMYKSYRLAKTNIPAAKAIYPQKRWYRESDLYFAQMIVSLSKDFDIVRKSKEMLQGLEEQYPNGEAIKFLASYFLDCGMDLHDTAVSMFLHKNTLKYRRERIDDLLGFITSDLNVSYGLVNMLALLRYMEAMEK